MAKRQAINVEADFSKGMIRDVPRHAIPDGGVYDSADFLLHQPGVAQKRGGTSYFGPASASPLGNGIIYANFAAGAQLLAGAADLSLYKITSGAATDLGGSDVLLYDKPKFWSGGGKERAIFPHGAGALAPIAYDGSAAPATLGGTPPAGRFCALYKTRLALAGSTANPNRIYFSPTPDITSTWDTTNVWLDCDNAITGLAALQNTLLVFSRGHIERIVGTVPPGVSGSDMDRAPIADIGCTDPLSISIQDGMVVFANPRGVYMTDGASQPISLTKQGGIENYWQSLFTTGGYVGFPTNSITSGIIRSFLFISGPSSPTTLMCHLPTRAWWRVTNMFTSYYGSGSDVSSPDELYFTNSAGRITAISGIFNPTSSNKNDADGTAVAPMIETRSLGHGPTLKHFGRAHVSYDMRDAASDNPTLAVTAAPGLEATTYAAVSESPLVETTDETRKPLTVAKVSQGVSMKFTQSSASSKTELYALEYEERPLAPVEGGQ